MARKPIDYSPHAADTFNVWIELGARRRGEQRVLSHSPLGRHEKKLRSSSREAEAMIHEPLKVLLADGIPGVRPDSRVTSTIHRHELGLRKRIIRVVASVDESNGDVSLEFHKEI